MKRIFIRLALVIVICSGVLFWIYHPGKADMAPFPMAPGSSISPSNPTQVRMMEERVQMDLVNVCNFDPGADQFTKCGFIAQVSADFRMKNLGKTAEQMKVYFPLGKTLDHQMDLFITDFQVWAEGQPLIVGREEIADEQESHYTNVWATFPINFPSDQEVWVRVTYTLELQKTHDGTVKSIGYIFHTGSGWKGTIGNAQLIVNLPDTSSQDSVVSKPSGGKIDGRSITWIWNDFEPTEKDDFNLVLADPDFWVEVIKDQQEIERNPLNGSAWTRLGMDYLYLAQGVHLSLVYPNFASRAGSAFYRAAQLSPYDPEPYHQLFYLDTILTMKFPGPLTQAECEKLAYDINQTYLRTNELLNISELYDEITCPNKPKPATPLGIYPSLTATIIPSRANTPTINPIIVQTITAYFKNNPSDTPIPTDTLPPTYTLLPTKTINASRTSTNARTQMPLPIMSESPKLTVQPSPSQTISPTNPYNPWLGGIGIFVLISVGLGLIFRQRLQRKL